MTYSAGFWNLIAKRYARQPVADEVAYQEKIARTQEYLNLNMNVLEFGCGTGSTALLHAPKVKHYDAIDVSSGMIAIARQKLADTSIDNLNFHISPLEEFNVADGSVDAVLGLNILHLMRDHENVIRRVHTLLKPGGVFVSSTMCLTDNMAWFRYIAPLLGFLRLIPRLYFFSREQLLDCLEQAGFTIAFELEPRNKNGACFIIALKGG